MEPLIQRRNADVVEPGVDPDGLPRVINRTDLYTLVTRVGESRLFYSAESWVRVRLRLESAGPVDVGTRQEITPVLSGKGISLQEEDWTVFTLAKGNRLWYTSATVNRFQVIIEPIPYLDDIQTTLEKGFGMLGDLSARTNQLVGGALKAVFRR